MEDDVSLTLQWARLREQRAQLDAKEAEVIAKAMHKAGGVVAHAARELGIARTTLASRLEVLGVRTRSSRSSSTRVIATRADDATPSAATGARDGDAA